MNVSKMRPGQQGALNTITERVRSKEQLTAIVLPTRYGKSDVIRAAAMSLVEDGLVCGGVVCSPGLFLRGQIVSTEKLAEMHNRYEVFPPIYSKFRVGTLTEYDSFSNGEYLISVTSEAATLNRDIIFGFVTELKRRFGLPPIFFFDEAHTVSTVKARGEFVEAVVSAGGYVVLLTATPERADGELISGFDYVKTDQKSFTKKKVKDAGDGENDIVFEYAGTRCMYKLVAHHTTTFQQAWDEDPSPLCHLNREAVDVRLKKDDGTVVLLSSLSANECRPYLTQACKDQSVIQEGVRLALSDKQKRRRIIANSATIVFTGNDEVSDGQLNKHARAVEREFERQQTDFGFSNLKIVVATMKSESDSSAIIEDFINGIGDVLIVKQMGGAGLDCERIKTMLDLSSIRTVASCVQRYMRVATPFGAMQTGTIITLSDAISTEIWDNKVVKEGGAVSASQESELELIDERKVPKPKDGTSNDDDDYYEVDGAEFSNYDDSRGLSAGADKADLVDRVCQAFPEMLNMLTKAQIAQRCQELTGDEISVAATKHAESQEHDVKFYRDSVNTAAKRFASKQISYNIDRDMWLKHVKDIINRAKRKFGIKGIELDKITNKDTLEKMAAFIKKEGSANNVVKS